MQDCIHAPKAAAGRVYRARQPRATALYRCAARHAPELRAGGRFGRRRALLGKLCNIVERLFARFNASAWPGARPGIILFVQTFGDLVNFNPHIHVLAADGAFDADGGFSVLPPIPRKVLEP